MISRIDVAKSAVLVAVMTQLRTAMNLTPNQCFLTLDPNSPPALPVGGAFYLGVSPGASHNGIDEAGGEQFIGNFYEGTTIIVTAYTRCGKLDSVNEQTAVLLDPTRGLIAIQDKIFWALLAQDLETPDGNRFLRQLTAASGSEAPQADASKNVAWLSTSFMLSYDRAITG